MFSSGERAVFVSDDGERLDCPECGGFDVFYDGGEIVREHVDGCEMLEVCVCSEPDCEDCERRREAHFRDPHLISVGLRLLIGAIDDDVDAVRLALADIPECPDCDRAVWLSVLQTAGHYGTEVFADVLRLELLSVLDSAASASGGDDD